MHILASQSRQIDDANEAIDLGQEPADIVLLSSADTELSGFSRNTHVLENRVSLRLANLLALNHPYSIDLYAENTLQKSKCVILRLLGGIQYWPYGVERVTEVARLNGHTLLVVPGDDKWDADLACLSTVKIEQAKQFWRYCTEGGDENLRNALKFAAYLIGKSSEPAQPKILPRAGIWCPTGGMTTLSELENRFKKNNRSQAALVFYRAMVQGAATAPIKEICEALDRTGMDTVPIFVSSLKDPESVAILQEILSRLPPDIVLNGTAFAVSSAGEVHQVTPLDSWNKTVLQVVFSSVSRSSWRESDRGLGVRDLAMHVVLPEIDGRILTRAVSFKDEGGFDPLTQSNLVKFTPDKNRVEFVAELSKSWAKLGSIPVDQKKVSIILANYPNKDGRIANGVGLDTPESVISLVKYLTKQGYNFSGFVKSSKELMKVLLGGVTNNYKNLSSSKANIKFSVREYNKYYNELSKQIKQQVEERWGMPQLDPFVLENQFVLPIIQFENLTIGIQPARGYNIDPKETYHDPSLVPPHNYFAFYFWLRYHFKTDAVIHMGKHGNLEWLPGKAVALSENCFPEAVLGPVPNIYPFIVNDPGEGSQAKRRNSAVIIDHLTPPLTRAESYGIGEQLELLLDEYYLASGVDPRRTEKIEAEIFDLAIVHGFDVDLGLTKDMDRMSQLSRIDAHLCDLKELQIRDGLHVLGQSPTDRSMIDLATAITRVPRGSESKQQSLHRAIANDLKLNGFDPLDCNLAEPWSGERPKVLLDISPNTWRTAGDTVERIELLASKIVGGQKIPSNWSATQSVFSELSESILPAINQSGECELAAVGNSLQGNFVQPGPSGAPTRGRPDVLPTGRNFYSVDVRAVPTEIAWNLGMKSATRLLERYYMEEGQWPTSLALTAWGTSNMRTGGDDIAQALALIGAKPVWEKGSGRVTGFEVVSMAELGRPRIDVTLRISGFFRDAFPHQIEIFDSAVRAVAALDEPESANPIAHHVNRQTSTLVAAGMDENSAKRQSTFRVFGSKPGAYGAGLQVLIDEGIWQEKADFANSYIEWGSYAYGGGTEGDKFRNLFEERLGRIDVVVQNQDNREHDLLDSDDYYQFEGGIAAAVESLRKKAPRIFHNDHSRPERPIIRTLEEEIGRVVRGRAANPKWIAGVMRHGYKGAFELAATVDYLFAFASTTNCVKNHHFDQLYAAYLDEEKVRKFIQEHNPDALKEIASRLTEAIDRGLWAPRRNSTYNELMELKNLDRETANYD